jgi:hypothetical protein
MKTILRQLLFIPMLALIVGCASDSETESEPSERSKGFEISAGTGSNNIDCPSRNSTCYAQVVKMCGELGVKEVSVMGQSRVSTAGRNDDDPFARADRQKNYNQPVSLRCKEPKPESD